jgi:hypothetical protein
MNDEPTRAKLFITRLLANPALQDLNPLHKEEQIIQFLHSNAGQLFPTLSSDQFTSSILPLSASSRPTACPPTARRPRCSSF